MIAWETNQFHCIKPSKDLEHQQNALKHHCLLTPPSEARHTKSRHGMAQHGTTRHGTTQHGMARHGTVWHGTCTCLTPSSQAGQDCGERGRTGFVEKCRARTAPSLGESPSLCPSRALLPAGIGLESRLRWDLPAASSRAGHTAELCCLGTVPHHDDMMLQS